jgi:hypothetical protein
MRYTKQTFGQAIEAMKQGKLVSRDGWNGKGLFVFMQVPSEVPIDVITRMTSLPPAAKEVAISRCLPLRYSSQMALLSPDNSVSGWAPSAPDTLANDWCIHEPFVVAGETVGAASPTT